MANTLIKDFDISYKPGQAGIRDFESLVSQPPRSIKRKQRVCRYVYPSDDEVGELGENIGVSGSRICYDTEVLENYPGTPAVSIGSPRPATPAKLIYEYNIGWTGRARSRSSLKGAGAYTFTVPASSSGVVIGLSVEPKPAGYNDILFGFFVSRGVVRVYESGQEAAYIGFHPGAELKIQRTGGMVRYFVDGTQVRERTNESATVFLAAAMYSGGDTVLDASVEEIISGGGSAEFPAPMAFGGVSWSYGIAEFPVMSAEGSQIRRGSGIATFDIPQAYGGVRWADGTAALLAPDASGYGFDLLPTYAIGDAFLPGLTAGGYGTTGEIGLGSAVMELMDAIGADRPYAYGSAKMAEPRAIGYNWLAEDELAVVAFSDMTDAMAGEVELFALIDSSMTFQGLMSVQVIGAASIESAMQWGDSYSVQQTINALIQSLMSASSGVMGGKEAMSVWAMHMDAAGSTRYEGYDFTGFAKVDGKYYGLQSDGLYLLEGDDDNGTAVAARVNFGNLNFGTMARKALPYVYVGMASSGKTYLKVTADGSTYTYEVRHNTELMKTHRFEPGRGLRASFYELELMADGTVFDLHSIEFQPIELTRRL